MAVTLTELRKSPLYFEELGIRLPRDDDREYFKGFLASLLYGGRISETIARHTYQAFVEHGLLTPRKIRNAGWNYLVNPVMREGGYVHYDGRKSDQVLRDCEQLLDSYKGSLKRLHEAATDAHDLEERLLAFYGVGPVTLNIFYVSCGSSGERPTRNPCRWSMCWRRSSTSISSVSSARRSASAALRRG